MAYYTIYLVFVNVLFWSALEIHFVSTTDGLEEICRNWNAESKFENISEVFGDMCPESMYLELLHPDICDHIPETHSEVEVTFFESVKDMTKQINKTAEFQCITNPKGEKYWYLNEVYLNVNDPKIKGKIMITKNGETLEIHETAGPEFYGKYTCEVVTENGIKSESGWYTAPKSDSPFCTLDFAVKPEKTIFLQRKEHHMLKCGAQHHVGGVSIKWYKQNGDSKRDLSKSTETHKPLILQRGHLFITSARQEHQGEYICEIKDQTGCVISTSVNVEVYTHVNEICGTAVNNLHHSNDILEESEDKYTDVEKALEGSAPWQVSLQHQKNGHKCGGIIINRYWILTAAHCFMHSASRLRSHNSVLKAGIQNLFTSVDHIQMRYIRRRNIHPHYKNKDFDIALIKLNTPLKLNDYVRPICLPIGQDNFGDGYSGIITGLEENSNDEDLMQATVKTKQCTQSPNLQAMFCADAYGRVKSTDAYSGGPLQVPKRIPGRHAASNNLKWFLAGVISHVRGVDSVYTNVTNELVLSWIIAQTSDPANLK